ncbi:MAG: helix-turn-helix transcriptional regulator [Bacteroidales bacterium]|nr:helix-turn-helix transcriptional regulator [Bacteroidales bacterium]
MKFIFLIAAFNAFFFTVLLFQKKPRALHDNILIFWLTYLGAYIGVYAFYSHELFTHFQLLSISLISLLMLHGPFLYYYILTLVSDKNRISGIDLLHLILFVLFNLYILISSFNPEISEKLNIEKVSPGDNPPLLFSFFLIMTAFSGTLYFLLTIRLFKKLDINIFNNFSNPVNIDLYWIRKLVLVFGIIWTALISVTVIHHIFHMFSMVFCTDGLFLSLSVFVILIGYFGLKQKVIFSSEDIIVLGEATRVQTKYSGSRLSDSEAKQYTEKLTDYMKSAKPYLNPDLSLPQLASELNISSHYLSQVINEQFNLNFFDFVNGYRVDAFKEKIIDPEFRNFSLLGIAFECGFNSKSAFNRIFKQSTGITPSQYKKSV